MPEHAPLMTTTRPWSCLHASSIRCSPTSSQTDLQATWKRPHASSRECAAAGMLRASGSDEALRRCA
eukprot:5713188-Pyramimonas_sp.AAC.1